MSTAIGSPLSADELEQVLRGHGLPPRAAGGPPRVVTGRVLHVASAGGELAIKVFAPGQAAQARTEGSLLEHLGAGDRAGYRVQRLVRTVDGRVLLELGERRVLVTRWEHGVHRSYREIDADGWAALGRTLAALHLRLDQAPALPLPRWVEGLQGRDLDGDRRTLQEHRRRAAVGDRPGAELVGQLLADRAVLLDRHAARCVAALPDGDDRPIHNDYNVHNYLFHDDGPPTILDWERAILAPREFEVCRCLAHLPLVAPAFAWAFVAGYLERRALDPDLVGWAVDAAVAMHALKHWPVEAWLAGAPGAEDRIAGIAEIVRSFADGRARLSAFAGQLRAAIRRRGAHREVR
jgi:Ser/Thr protein kinase RdoA (MazF antagonist)